MSAPADRVVIVVFDGLRPDMIEGRMPNLEAFGRTGAVFTGARSVFPSVTRVATTSLGSGHWPRTHGIVGNAFHQPDVVQGRALDTSSFDDLTLARAAWGRVVGPETLGEALAAAGRRMAVIHSGSAGSAFLCNAEVAANAGHWTFSIHGATATQTPDATEAAERRYGALPKGGTPKHDQIAYAAEVALGATGEDGPEVVLIWLCEPDSTYHSHGLGDAETDAVMASADTAFARILAAATEGPRGPRTAIMAVSDHGQISTTARFEIESLMRADGFDARVRPEPDTAIALTLGSSGEVRCLRDEAALVPALAGWLMGRPEIGMVFARDDLMPLVPGALPLSAVNLDHARAPSLFYTMHSEDGPDRFGLPGHGLMTGGVAVGGGMHGGLNRNEMATVLQLAIPEGPRGIHDDRPCALPDIAPTVLALLGLPSGAMAGTSLLAEAGPVEVNRLTAEHLDFRQVLERRRGAGAWMLDRGGRT